MPGIYSKSNRPKLAGAYFNFTAKAQPVGASGDGGVVAIPFVHDWGPYETLVRVDSFGDFQSIYGGADDTDGYLAVKQAFLGEDVEGRSGASQVLCYRFGGAAAAKASIALSNGSTTALTLQAIYEGTKGNNFRATVQEHIADTSLEELVILDGTTVLETYVYANSNITDVAAQIDGTGAYVGQGSHWVRTTGTVTSGTALAVISGATATGGNNGNPAIASDWTAFMSALEVEPFNVLAAYGLTDSGIQASLKAWAAGTPTAPGLNLKGRRFFVVIGGAAGESIVTAATRSGALADPNILNIGVGTVTSENLGPLGTAIDLSTAQLTARIAGIKAARAEYQSLTHARLRGVSIKVGATVAEQNTAFDEGVMTLARDSHSEAPVHLKTALSTWTAPDAAADPSKPYKIYRQPKYVHTMHAIESDLTQYAEEEIIGLRPINGATREALVGRVKSILGKRELLGVIQPGWTAGIDQDPPPTDDDEFIAIAISLKFGRALEQVYFSVTVA